MAYAFGELLYYLRGDNNLEAISYYSSFFNNISDDGKTINSAYGFRIFGFHPMIPFDQWKNCVKLLTDDPASRQAIIHIHTPNNRKTKDEVCTLTLQFLIRNDKLNLIVNMRSNDIIFGYTYDVFCFSMLQELMANELGVKMGKYIHNAGSFHIYEHGFYGKKFDDFLSLTIDDPLYTKYFFYSLNGISLKDKEIWKEIQEVERDLRLTGTCKQSTFNKLSKLNPWFADGLEALRNLANKKHGSTK